MISQNQCVKIRHMHFRGNVSINEIARKTSLSRNTVRKWLRAPSGTEVKYHKATALKTIINPDKTWLLQALKDDLLLAKRNRRSVRSLFSEILKQGFSGGYSCVTEFVRNWRKHDEVLPTKTNTSESLQHWMEWLYSIKHPHRPPSDAETLVDLNKIYDVISPSPNSPRTKALVVLAKIEGFSVHKISKYLTIAPGTVRRYLAAFHSGGEERLLKGRSRLRKLAGNKIWGMELTNSEFSESNNCKDPAYR